MLGLNACFAAFEKEALETSVLETGNHSSNVTYIVTGYKARVARVPHCKVRIDQELVLSCLTFDIDTWGNSKALYIS